MKKIYTYCNLKYLLFSLIAFILELVFVFINTNTFLRSYATDFFAVIYVYFFLRFVKISVLTSVATTFVIAYSIEIIQSFNIFNGSENIFILLVLGGTYDFYDFFAYNIGLFFVVLVEHKFIKNPR